MTDSLTLVDSEGDRIHVDVQTNYLHVYENDEPGVLLSRERVAVLADFLLSWLTTDAPSETEHPDSTRDGYDWPDAAGSILHDAHAAVYGDREADYGHPREDFTRQAIIWTGLLHHKLADGAHLEPEDIARCMVGTKLARDVHSPKRDNRVDGAGYFLTLDRLATGR